MGKIKNHFKKYGNLYFFYIIIFTFLSLFIWLFFLSDYLKNFLLWLENFVQTKKEYVYLVAFLSAVCEGTIFLSFIPGTTYIVTLGVFLARGDVNGLLLLPIVIVGAVLGDLLGYALGSFLSDYLKKNNYHQNKHYLAAQNFIKIHGGKSVFLARFVSGLKEIIPFTAGILTMHLQKFMFWNFLGAIGWSMMWIGIGYISGNYITQIEYIVRTVGIAFLIFFITMAFIFYKKNQKILIHKINEMKKH